MIYSILAAALISSVSSAELKTASNGKKITSQYIIRLNPSETATSLKSHIMEMKSKFGTDVEELNVYENLGPAFFMGYSAKLNSRALEGVLRDSRIMYVEEDQIAQINDCQEQSNPDWGLARTNWKNYTSTATFNYDYTTGASGSNVDAYIIDTGIYCENNDFTQKKTGTCTFGYSAVTNNDGSIDTTDGNGHGTHCAGTVAGITYGVAKEANLIAVKVLADSGSGAWSGVIAGVDWVAGQAAQTGRKSVANMSLGGGKVQSVNDAVTGLVNSGVTTAVAAGNDNSDACNYTPASTPTAVTVAASDSSNNRASYSNYGSCVDLYGPGSSITSAWIGSPSAINTISGTSMASPHVAGVAAKILSYNPSYTPSDVTNKLLSDATQGVVNRNPAGTPNLMVYGSCT
jgi:serine protease